jgi:hypothetical protein
MASRSTRGGIKASGDNLIAVGTEGQAGQTRGVAAKGEDVVARLHVPELQGAIEARRREPPTVRANAIETTSPE